MDLEKASKTSKKAWHNTCFGESCFEHFSLILGIFVMSLFGYVIIVSTLVVSICMYMYFVITQFGEKVPDSCVLFTL